MRRANEAILHERHPIPTIDEITQGMNGSCVFSKLDLKWGYHQLELTPESRDITTFVTHCGLYRYKRLLFGVNSASEQYQYEIQRALAGVEGQVNISDDIMDDIMGRIKRSMMHGWKVLSRDWVNGINSQCGEKPI